MSAGEVVYRRYVPLVVLLCGLAVCNAFADSPPESRSLSLLYSGNLDGELEPCGCTIEGDFGGIRRRASVMDELREKQPGLVSVSSGGLLVSGFASDRLKSDYILRGFTELGYDAIGIQWNDVAFGAEFLAQHKLPWVASNWQESTFAARRMLETRGRKIAVFSWLDPESSPYRKMRGAIEVVDNKLESLRTALVEARREKATTLLLTTLPMQEAREQLPLDNVDILVVRSAYEVYGEPFRDGRTLVLQPGSRGMRLGLLEFAVDENGEILSWTHKVIPLGVDVADSPRLAGWYDEYNKQVEVAYRESVERRKTIETGDSPFAGDAVCESCHQEIHKKWEETRHSHAYRKLEEVNKAFDPGCIVCHTVGFDTPGGFLDADSTPQLRNVQCESCHGPARVHALSAGQQKTVRNGTQAADMCAQCHTPAHSPLFDLEKYWPKIAH